MTIIGFFMVAMGILLIWSGMKRVHVVDVFKALTAPPPKGHLE